MGQVLKYFFLLSMIFFINNKKLINMNHFKSGSTLIQNCTLSSSYQETSTILTKSNKIKNSQTRHLEISLIQVKGSKHQLE